MSRFPLPGNYSSDEVLTVDKIRELYEGITDEVDADLIDAAILPRLNRPEIPSGLENIIEWSEVSAEDANGEQSTILVDPQPPTDLTDLTDLNLGKVMWFFTGWTNYVQSETTRTKGDLRKDKRCFKALEAHLRVYYKETEGVPASQIADRLPMDPRWAELDIAVLKGEIKYERSDARYESYRRILNNCSREQTRRAEDISDSKTAAAYGWRKSKP